MTDYADRVRDAQGVEWRLVAVHEDGARATYWAGTVRWTMTAERYRAWRSKGAPS